MKKKILLCVNYLKDIGGIGTSAINLIIETHNSYDITLCITSNYISPKYNIPSDVKIIEGSNYLRDVIVDRTSLSNQNIFQQVVRNVRRILNHYVVRTKGIERAIRRIRIDGEYDVAIAFSDFRYSTSECKCFDYDVVLNNVNAKRKVAWIHNEPTKLGWTRELALKRLSGFDAIINVSEDCKRIFDTIVPELKEKSFVVYNIYDINKIQTHAFSDKMLYANNGKIHFVTVARIQVAQKRIDRIIETCRRLKEEGITNFDWTLVGTSQQIGELIERVNSFEISELITFVGLQPNPYPYMSQADAFVLASDYEGYGMTIKEAQILKTPTFVTNFGPAHEAVKDRKQGEICENSTDGLYNMIKSILQAPQRICDYKEYLKQNPVDNSLAIKQFDNICTEKQ